MENLVFSVRNSVKMGWKLAKPNLIVLCGVTLAFMAIYFVIDFFVDNKKPGFLDFVLILFLCVFSMVYTLGYYRMTLDITEGKEPEFSAFREGLQKFWKYFVLGLIYFCFIFVLIIIVAGIAAAVYGVNSFGDPMLFLKSPKFILFYFVFWFIVVLIMIRFMYAPFIILDTTLSAWASIKKSWEITKGKYRSLIGMFFVFSLINILGLIALVIGMFVTMAVTSVAFAVSYRMLMYETQLKAEKENEAVAEIAETPADTEITEN